MPDRPIQTAHAYDGDLAEYLNSYKYQPRLTPHLDALPDEPFSQETVNEIVLWKVNRYVRLSEALRHSLHSLRTLSPKDHRRAEPVLLNLLDCDGVDLPMASTFLRFQNAEVFQIIDRHAYRAVFGKRYPMYSATPSNTKVSVYFKYVDALHSISTSSGVSFRDLDRILYEFDKDHNGTL
jgi:thermostable 8-oxoguanine DNA glycosylase